MVFSVQQGTDKQTPHKKAKQSPKLDQARQTLTQQGKPTKQQAKQTQQALKASKKQWAKLYPDAKHQKSKSLGQAQKQKKPRRAFLAF